MKIPAYCSFEYLEQLTNIKTVNPEDLSFNKKAIEWLNLISSSLKVYTDANWEQIQSLMLNPFIKHLIKKNRLIPSTETLEEIKSNPEIFFSQNKGVAVYFMKIGNDEYEKKYGSLFLSPKMNSKLLTSDFFKMFTKGTDYSWESIRKIFNPHHSLVIADPYVFDKNNFASFKSILLNILPGELETNYHLTIIGSDQQNYSSLPNSSTIHSMVDELSEILKKKIKNVLVEYHIYNNRKEFHDRFAITNHIHLNSGRGLGIFKDDSGFAKAGYSTYWSGKKPCTIIESDYDTNIEFYNTYVNNLKLLKSWIEKSTQQITSNPLLNIQ